LKNKILLIAAFIIIAGLTATNNAQGFANTTFLSDISISANTGEKPQSKVWTHNGSWFAVLPNSSGTHVWRLDGTTWSDILNISGDNNSYADCKVVGDVTHIFLYSGTASELVSIEYLSGSNSYQFWTTRSGNVAITLTSGVETAAIDIDADGRMWLASDGGSSVNVRWSDSPYSTWNGPISLATVAPDDICAIAAFDDDDSNTKIGVLWSNQSTDRFGFKYHIDGADPNTWSSDEVPADQSAQNQGNGMADDHLNLAVASDGTIYAGVKTSYDTGGFPKIALLIRRPNGTWDNLYEVDGSGTRGIAVLNETLGKIRVIYTASEGNNNIVYKESSTSSISFGSQMTLISGSNNNVTSTKQNFTNEVVILASNGSTTASVLASDVNYLAGHWMMDEGSGSSIVDESVNGNDGTTSGSPLWVPGVFDQALSFDGSNDYATVPDDPSLDIADAITVAAWIKPEVTGVTQRIIRKVNTVTNRGYSLFLGSGGYFSIKFNDDDVNSCVNTNSSAYYSDHLNEWIHIAATFDGTTIRTYFNGVANATFTPNPTITILDNTELLSIGARLSDGGSTASDNYFQGAIDDARVYNRALSSSEIQDLATTTATNSISFQNGDVNGYSSTMDTRIHETAPTADYGNSDYFKWDSESSGGIMYALLRFDNIFGSGPNQIPAGSSIESAILIYNIYNVGHPGNVNEVLVDWEDNVTYSTFGGDAGVQGNEYGNFINSTSANPTGTYQVDLTASLTSWSTNPSSNRGWIFIPSGTDGANVRSSEYATVGQRPKLVVNYTSTPPDPPAAPSSITISAQSHGHINLTWNDNSNNETSFEIERKPDLSGTAAFGPLASVGANTTSYDNFNLVPGTEYFYRVSAKNGGGTSDHTGDGNSATTPAEAVYALEFSGSDYVTFGQATNELGVTVFTLEAWVKRAGGGVPMRTGEGGFDGGGGQPKIFPVFTKGMGEGDADANKNLNFFLGITETGFIGADFEDNSGGINHPVWGVTTLAIGTWYHIAATYDEQTWRLYLNGVLDKTLTLSSAFTPQSESHQHAALATGLQSSGNTAPASGYFSGMIDEVRIWDVARTQAELFANKDLPISIPTPNLIGRWGLNEGSALFVNDASGRGTEGSIIGGGTSWIENPMSLPVELSSFSAKLNSGTVTLNWRTETEVNNYGFEVERKTQDVRSERWEKIGFVDGYGNTNSPKEYSFIDKSPTGGRQLSYRLKQIDNDGSYEYSNIVEVEFVPTEFALYQNYPNPFNPTTTIKYSIPSVTLRQAQSDIIVTIIVYDVLGNEIATLVNEEKPAGYYETEFNATGIASGMYIYRMQAGTFVRIKKMMILK
jgi:hypothetical protein